MTILAASPFYPSVAVPPVPSAASPFHPSPFHPELKTGQLHAWCIRVSVGLPPTFVVEHPNLRRWANQPHRSKLDAIACMMPMRTKKVSVRGFQVADPPLRNVRGRRAGTVGDGKRDVTHSWSPLVRRQVIPRRTAHISGVPFSFPGSLFAHCLRSHRRFEEGFAILPEEEQSWLFLEQAKSDSVLLSRIIYAQPHLLSWPDPEPQSADLMLVTQFHRDTIPRPVSYGKALLLVAIAEAKCYTITGHGRDIDLSIARRASQMDLSKNNLNTGRVIGHAICGSFTV